MNPVKCVFGILCLMLACSLILRIHAIAQTQSSERSPFTAPIFIPPGEERGDSGAQQPRVNLEPDSASTANERPSAGGGFGVPGAARVIFRPPPTAQVSPWTAGQSSLYNTTDFCGGAYEREVQDDGSCPVSPSSSCDRTLTDITARYGADYRNLIHHHVARAAAVTDISPALLLALMDAESRFNPMANNDGGDTGLAQFQVSTAQHTLSYWRQRGGIGVRLQSYTLESHPPPPHCSRRDWPTISRRCLSALMDESVCGNERDGLRPNLFCPQFASYMMAWHLKRMSVEPRQFSFGGQSMDLALILQGDGDPVAQARYLASIYNRGCLIQNSVLYVAENHQGLLTSARDYGRLWSAPVSASFSDYRQRPCRNERALHTQRINRCYMWKVTGLCGGFGDSMIGQYLKLNYCNAGASSNSGSSPQGGTQ